jgi:basic membrane protein A
LIAKRADLIFTMLNAGRTGAIEACREGRIAQIGNVGDWTLRMPEVFVASAVANASMALEEAVADFVAGRFGAGRIRRIGVENPQAVRLAMAPRIAEEVRTKVAAAARAMASTALEVSTEWSGEEFSNPG